MQTFVGTDIIFYYEIPKIFNEVTKRTSLFGKMRVSKDIPDAFDRFSLTDGEDFMFTPFLEEATTEAFDWMKAFARRVDNAVSVVKDIQPIQLSANNGVDITFNNRPITSFPYVIKQNVYQDVIDESSSILDVKMENTSNEDVRIKVILTTEYKVVNMLGTHTKYAEDMEYAYNINSGEVLNEIFFLCDIQLGDSINIDGVVIPKEELSESPIYPIIKSIEITHVNPKTLHKGDIVDYTFEDGLVKRYLVTEGCYSHDFNPITAIELDVQPNSIVFRLRMPEWWDDNMLHSADNAIFEYIVNHIIWKWLIIVYPNEAQVYEALVEKAGKNIQTRLNGESKQLQRKYSMF